MNHRYLLDSWAILALVYEEKPAAGRIQELIHQASGGQAHLLLSVINLGEVFYIVGGRSGVPTAERIVDGVKRMPINLVPVDEHRVLAAARYTAAYPISYANAFAASAAAELDAILVTGDAELLALEGKIQLERITRA